MPDTSNVIVFVDLSNEMSTLCTCIVESLEPQLEKPSVLIMSAPNALPHSANDANAAIAFLILVGRGQIMAEKVSEIVPS